YFQLALDRSPQLVPALRGAARVAKRNGQRERARELYGRLLANAPGDREAKTYLEDTAPSSVPVTPTGECSAALSTPAKRRDQQPPRPLNTAPAAPRSVAQRSKYTRYSFGFAPREERR